MARINSPNEIPLRRGVIALLAVLLLVPAAGQAQIVNVQSRFSELLQEGPAAGFNASADWRTGNISLLVLGGETSLQYGRAPHQLMGSFRGEITLAESISDGRRTFEHLRYRYWALERWALETFAQHEYDPQRRYRVRLLLGAGPRWVPLSAERGGLALGVSLMGERIEISQGQQDDAGEIDSFVRVSSYVIGRLLIQDSLTMTQSLYFQPRISAWDDLRLLAETALSVPLTERVGLSIAFVLTRQSRPPEGVVPVDTRLLSRITVTL